ncbi:MAG: FtsQ-type POTRA domain-containing protein [Saprospiraceae bacterium]|nr:FtsQ-type POTRA domain-containing protein [Saprospiraceae bacterium]
MKVHPKRISWIVQRLSKGLGVLILLFVIIAAIRHKQTSKVKNIVIEIEKNEAKSKFVTQEDVLEAITAENGGTIEGKAIGEIQVNKLEEVLEKKNIYIKQAQVYIDALNTVNIHVKQRVPIMRVCDMNDETSGYYLDSDGVRVMASDKTSRQYPARVVVVTGAIGHYTENYLEAKDNKLKKLFNLVKFIQKDPFLDAQIEQIHMVYSGDVILTPKLGDHSIHFGMPDEHIEDKFDRLKVFYKEGLSRMGWNEYKSISLAYKGQVVGKKHKKK